MNILFVTDKWCAANPNFGLTNHYHNLFNTFAHAQPDCKYNILHFDESAIIYQNHIDNVLLNYCGTFKPDAIFYVMLGDGYNNVLGSKLNPTLTCLERIKNKGIFNSFIWCDTGFNWGLKTIEELQPYADLHIVWDNPRSERHDTYSAIENCIRLWTPEDETLYHDRDEKNIDASFLASLAGYYQRINFVQEAKKRKLNIHISGGQRQAALSAESYASIVRRSKIGINFSSNIELPFHQAKGRIFEYTASKALLLDSDNPSTQDFYKKDVDYIAFSDLNDLIEKIEYYVNNENERQVIANNGYKRFKENWTAQRYWDIIMERVRSGLKR